MKVAFPAGVAYPLAASASFPPAPRLRYSAAINQLVRTWIINDEGRWTL